MAPKSTKVCSVAMCTKPTRRGQPYCYAHYMKKWRYGTPTPKHQEFREDLTGRRFDELVVTEYAGSGYWSCMCDCGAALTRRAGELNRIYEKGFRATCGNRTVHRRLDWVGYSSAHGRVRSERGSAGDYFCVDCGEVAQHWSYDNKDSDEFISQEAPGKGCRYSLKTEHYEPRCVMCHKRYDMAHQPPKIVLKCVVEDCERDSTPRRDMCKAHQSRLIKQLRQSRRVAASL